MSISSPCRARNAIQTPKRWCNSQAPEAICWCWLLLTAELHYSWSRQLAQNQLNQSWTTYPSRFQQMDLQHFPAFFQHELVGQHVIWRKSHSWQSARWYDVGFHAEANPWLLELILLGPLEFQPHSCQTQDLPSNPKFLLGYRWKQGRGNSRCRPPQMSMKWKSYPHFQRPLQRWLQWLPLWRSPRLSGTWCQAPQVCQSWWRSFLLPWNHRRRRLRCSLEAPQSQ